jgi:hypothetical protein
MRMFRRLAVAGQDGAGLGVGLVTAGVASAAPPVTIHNTTVLVAESAPAPGLLSLTYYNYQPKVAAPGFQLTSSTSELCLVGPLHTVCNFRVTDVGPAATAPTLTGNAVMTPFGQVGTITGGSKAWRGARGVFQNSNIAPNVTNSTWVFSTP